MSAPLRFETLQLHAGQQVDSNTKARAVPILSDHVLCVQQFRPCSICSD